MRVLFIGGSGEISRACVEQAISDGHEVLVFNRGNSAEGPVPGARQITGDMADEQTYRKLASLGCEVVCQFLAYRPDEVERDIALFSATRPQYVFVSSASIYRKPIAALPITEQMPLGNPFWEYSRQKQACEERLLAAHTSGQINATIVRPSHTYRRRLPSVVIDDKHLAWRITNGKPLIVPGDGESIWTVTHAADFARAYVRLFGEPAAFGECFHITSSIGHTWTAILTTVASVLGRPVDLHTARSVDLVDLQPSWAGPLLGDKSNSMIFDNSKIRTVAPDWHCEVGLMEGLQSVWSTLAAEIANGYRPDPATDRLVDHIVANFSGRKSPVMSTLPRRQTD